MKIDYHVHAVAHGEYNYTLEWLTKFVKQAKKMGLVEIGFSEHDDYILDIDSGIIEEIRKLHPDIGIKLGLEVDYKPEVEQDLKLLTSSKNFDYLIGSVHYIDGWGFDHPDYKHKFDEYDIDIVYQSYYDLVNKAVQSKLFDIIGHLDLIKIWGHKPRKKDVLEYVEPVLCSVKENDLVIEINGAGLRKPVGEMYPQFEIIQLMNQMNINVTLGSDAHHPDQIGLNIEEAIFLAKNAGYKNVISFKERERIILPL